jgi:capsular polysaccharide biosynthesis protein
MEIRSAEHFCDEVLHLSDGGAYKRVFPTYQNAHMLTDKIRRRYQEIWSNDAQYPPIKLYRLKNVSMYDVGYLVKDGVLIQESIQHLNETNIGSVKELITIRSSDNHQIIGSESFLLKRNSSSNYGHWLIEFMPYAHFFKNVRFKNAKLILEFFSKNPFGEIQLQTLNSFFVDRSRIHRCSRKSYFLTDVWIPSKSCIHSHVKHPDLVRLSRNAGLTAVFSDGSLVFKKPKQSRIFLSRRYGQKRRLVNEEEIKNMLLNFGFELFYPEDYSFNEQVLKFSTAEAVIGVTGAALTNILFCNPSCKIISLNPDVSQESFFWDIANLVNLNFSFVFGKSLNANNSHSDFLISLNDLRHALMLNNLDTVQ